MNRHLKGFIEKKFRRKRKPDSYYEPARRLEHIAGGVLRERNICNVIFNGTCTPEEAKKKYTEVLLETRLLCIDHEHKNSKGDWVPAVYIDVATGRICSPKG